MSNDESKPWDQQNGETREAYAAFWAYLELGPQRSIDKAWAGTKQGQNRDKRAPSYWGEWSKKWCWVERANVWDEHQRQEIEKQWRERQQEERERAWKLSHRLYEHVGKLLDRDLPEQFNQRDIAVIAKAAADIGRQASGLDAENKKNLPDWRAELAKAGIPETLIDSIERQLTNSITAALARRDSESSSQSPEESKSDKVQ